MQRDAEYAFVTDRLIRSVTTSAAHLQDGEGDVELEADYPLMRQLMAFLGEEKLPFKSKADPSDRVVIMFGAGIDSYLAIVKALLEKKWITIVHVDYGQPTFAHEAQVMNALERAWYAVSYDKVSSIHAPFQKDLNRTPRQSVIDGRVKFERVRHRLVFEREGMDWENYIIPCRNAFLGFIGAQFGRRVWIVSNKRENWEVGARDKTPKFYAMMSAILRQHTHRQCHVQPVFHLLSKAQAVQQYVDAGGDVHTLLDTFSCYTPPNNDATHILSHGRKQCGHCYACFKRYGLFQHFNVEVDFNQSPMKGPNWDKFRSAELAKGRDA